jgi:DNA segregation ATPase FtsK/SpoIIIE-like protein
MFEQQDELQERRLQHQLEMQSMQIETVLNRHQVPAHIDGGTVKSHSISFNLQTRLATGLERLRILKNDLIHTLGVPELVWSEENGRLQLHITKPDAAPVSLLDLMPMLPDLPPMTAVLGLAEDGRPVLLDFGGKDVTHVLVAGISKAGKTALLRSLAISLAMMNRQSRIQFVILDLDTNHTQNKSDLLPLNYLPHMLTEVMYEHEDVVDTLTFLYEEIDYRLASSVKTPTILVLIDKVISLLEQGDEGIHKAFTHLLQRGAEVGIHLIMTAQRTGTAVLNQLHRANISLQIVGQVEDVAQAKAATRLTDSQAEFLLGEGDFLAVMGDHVTHFQAAYIGSYDLHMTLQELYRKRPPALLARSLYTTQPITLSAHITENEQSFGFDGSAIHLAKTDSISPPNSETMEIYEEVLAFEEDFFDKTDREEADFEEDVAEPEVIPILDPSLNLFKRKEDSEENFLYLLDDEEDEEIDFEEFDDEEEEFDPVADVTTKVPPSSFTFIQEDVEAKTAENAKSTPPPTNWGIQVNSYKALQAHFENKTEEKEIESVDGKDSSIVNKVENDDDTPDTTTNEQDIETEYEDIEDDWLPFDED